MRKTLLGVLAAAAALVCVGVAACDSAPLAPGDIASGAVPDAAMSVADARVIQSVTGNGSVHGARTYTVSVHKLAGGTVTGWFHVRHRGKGGTHIRVAVDCLHVNGNRAWAGGVIVEAANPANIGLRYSFRVIDNGEGGGAPPDEINSQWTGLDCTSEWDSATRPLTIGNLQVRG
jgi:hypothetical protein